ncbi:dr1-associated corepressor homolog [Drosophila nasuta]|uniref:Dr1-associated corepressor homolog n=1 Tax=Drosophila albomicans TaxID=7291 RepID=A0A6P8WV46_DROAB|nr:dr1-associated corepressor homolog [Drosophila albomicans]XP_060652078.1 dr1-associated corepressor homolog [Drosophila nasuta]
MPSKKKKYNARFPAGRIKKIMQSDEEVGKVAQAVPIIISRTLELFVESLLTKTLRITTSRNAKTLSPSHMKQCIMSEQRFDFLKELVRNIPDISVAEEACNYNEDDVHSSEEQYPDSDTPYDLSLPSTSLRGLHHNGNSNSNNSSNTYVRSVSLNGVGLKRHHNPPPAPTPSVIMQTAALAQIQQQARPLPAKLARSESTPAYTPRGRPPNSSNNNSVHYNSSSRQMQMQTPETAIPAPICSYDVLSKPIVKIDYSNVQMPTTTTTADAADSGSAAADTTFNFDIAAPVINIDLTNIVAAGTTISQPTAKICYGLLSEDNTSVSVSVGGNNNSISKIASSVNCIGGKSKTTPIIPKASSAPAPITESLFELDEDYDNI